MKSKDGQTLDVVDESGNIIRQVSRVKIHTEGLLHREVHVWIYTSDGRLIFQHRAKDKDTYPDLLDASVGGHVEVGDNWEESALKELSEEAGIDAEIGELEFLEQTHTVSKDEVTDMTNNALRNVYAYRHEGSLSDLVIEDGKSQGFEAYSFEQLRNLSDKESGRFIPSLTTEKHQRLYSKIESMHRDR